MAEPPRELLPESPAGRNDPCPCGNGKKFKKCRAQPWPRRFLISTGRSQMKSPLGGRSSGLFQGCAILTAWSITTALTYSFSPMRRWWRSFCADSSGRTASQRFPGVE